MVFFHWTSSMHLVTMGKCGSWVYKEKKLVLLEGGLLEEITNVLPSLYFGLMKFLLGLCCEVVDYGRMFYHK